METPKQMVSSPEIRNKPTSDILLPYIYELYVLQKKRNEILSLQYQIITEPTIQTNNNNAN